MNKFYVTEDVAKKLRAKGYPYSHIIHFDNGVPIARIDEVLDWLREEKVLFVEVSVNNHTGFDFYFTIYEKGEECWIVCGFNEEWYDTYEGAALAGIEYVIDNLI